MLRHGADVDTLRARKANSALFQFFAVELVGSCADRLDEAKPLGLSFSTRLPFSFRFVRGIWKFKKKGRTYFKQQSR